MRNEACHLERSERSPSRVHDSLRSGTSAGDSSSLRSFGMTRGRSRRATRIPQCAMRNEACHLERSERSPSRVRDSLRSGSSARDSSSLRSFGMTQWDAHDARHAARIPHCSLLIAHSNLRVPPRNMTSWSRCSVPCGDACSRWSGTAVHINVRSATTLTSPAAVTSICCSRRTDVRRSRATGVKRCWRDDVCSIAGMART